MPLDSYLIENDISNNWRFAELWALFDTIDYGYQNVSFVKRKPRDESPVSLPMIFCSVLAAHMKQLACIQVIREMH